MAILISLRPTKVESVVIPRKVNTAIGCICMRGSNSLSEGTVNSLTRSSPKNVRVNAAASICRSFL